jgi:hypothetical protein
LKLGSDEHLSGPPQSDRVVVRPRRNDAVAHVDAPNSVSVPVKHVRATPVAPPPHSDRPVATAAHNDVAEHEDTPHRRDVPVKLSHKRPVLNVPHLRETDIRNARERVRTRERKSARCTQGARLVGTSPCRCEGVRACMEWEDKREPQMAGEAVQKAQEQPMAHPECVIRRATDSKSIACSARPHSSSVPLKLVQLLRRNRECEG